MNRSEAKKAGEKFFESSRPCRNGHFGRRYTSSGGCWECMALVRTIRNNLQVGNLILQVPMHKDLAPQFRDFANRVLRRDPAALLHLNLAAPPASEPVIHVDAESGRAYELVEGEWVRYRGTV